MDDLKVVAQALSLPADSAVEKVTERIGELIEAEKQGRVWKLRANENLSKVESDKRLVKEAEEARADAFFLKAGFKVTKAQADQLKKWYMGGPEGEKQVKEYLDVCEENDYLTRSHAITKDASPPTDPLAEIESRSVELMAKDSKLSKSDANQRVLNADPDLADRYRTVIVKGAGGAN